MMSLFKDTGLRWLWLSVLALGLDQWTKTWAENNMEGRVIEVMPHFNLILAHNKGAAFSFLADAGGWQLWFFSILAIAISIGLIVWLSQLKRDERWLGIALALVLSGAIGNVIDRLIYGYVIDFIDWYIEGYHWPAFNIADSAIVIGAIMLLIDSLFFAERKENESK